MIDLLTLKEISRISKSRLIMAVGLTEYNSISANEYSTYELEEIHKQREVTIGYICDKLGINNIKSTMIPGKEGHRIEVVETVKVKRLSKLQLLQYILYHFLPVDSNGIIKNISRKNLARALNCSVNTINNNNEALCLLGFISLSNISSNLFNTEIIGYKDNRKPKSQGGTGYIQMSKEMLMKMLFIPDVNSLRLIIRQYIRCDSLEGMSNSPSSEFSFKDYRFFLPKSIGFKSKILKILEDTSEFFIQSSGSNGVEFILKDQYNGKKQRKRKEALYHQELMEYLREVNVPSLEINAKELTQLSMEYGSEVIKMAIESYLSTSDTSSIKNLGGFLREKVRRRDGIIS